MLDILEDNGLMGAKPVDTHMDLNVKLCVDQGELLSSPNSYRRLVGKPNYLIVTRSDTTFAVSVVSQFMSATRLTHIETTLRIVRYLKAHLVACFMGYMVICVLMLLGQGLHHK